MIKINGVYLPVFFLILLMLIFKFLIGPEAASYFVSTSQLLIYYLFFLVFYKFRNTIRSSIQIPLNTKLFPLFRVVYVVLCLYSFFQNLTLIDSKLEPFSFRYLGVEFTYFKAYFFNAIYFLSLMGILVGYRIRLAFIVLFLSGGVVIPFSLEIFLKNIINFYAIFIPTYAWYGRKSATSNFDGWPVLLLVISLSFLMSVAGICKFFDPVWQNGLGLYYTLNIPYLTPKFLWFLLDYPNLLTVLSWVTIFVEVICLPLVLFKKTRSISLICLVFLGLFLSFIMGGIGIVGGPLVLTGCFLALSITNIPNKVDKWIPKIKLYLFNPKKSTSSKLERNYLSLILYSITFIYIVYYSINLFLNNLNYSKTPLYGNYIVHSEKLINESSIFHKMLKSTSKSLKLIEIPPHWRFIWSLHLFDYDHFFERSVFKVVFEDYQGNKFEQRKYYNEDGSISDEYPLFSNERFYYLNFRINEAIDKNGFDKNKFYVKVLIEEMNTLINYSNKDDIKFKSAKILIKHLSQPYQYQKNHKPWISNKWYTFYIYEADLNKELITDSIHKYNYSKIKIKEFEKGIIEPNF